MYSPHFPRGRAITRIAPPFYRPSSAPQKRFAENAWPDRSVWARNMPATARRMKIAVPASRTAASRMLAAVNEPVL